MYTPPVKPREPGVPEVADPTDLESEGGADGKLGDWD